MLKVPVLEVPVQLSQGWREVATAVEIANEPHTAYKYEMDRGMVPGKLVRDW